MAYQFYPTLDSNPSSELLFFHLLLSLYTTKPKWASCNAPMKLLYMVSCCITFVFSSYLSFSFAVFFLHGNLVGLFTAVFVVSAHALYTFILLSCRYTQSLISMALSLSLSLSFSLLASFDLKDAFCL